MSSRAFSRVILLSFAFLSGCYKSSTPLGPAERGVVNPEFLGTWICRNAADDANVKTLLVVAFDSSRYYLEWHDKELSEPQALREIRRRVKDESLYKPWVTCQRA